MTPITLNDLVNKTCWLFMGSAKLLGRIIQVNQTTVTVCDDRNTPREIALHLIDRVVPVNRDYHIKFMMTTLHNVLLTATKA